MNRLFVLLCDPYKHFFYCVKTSLFISQFLLFIVLLNPGELAAQNKVLDSLWKIYNNKAEADTSRVKAIYEIAMSYRDSNPDTAILLAEQQLKFANTLPADKRKIWTGRALSTIGISFRNKGNYSEALNYYFKVLKIREEIGDMPGLGNCCNNIGIVYNQQANTSKAVEFFLKALKLREDLGDKNGAGISAVNIGSIYLDQANYPKALEYYLKALKLREEIGDEQGIATCYGGIAIVYRAQFNYTKALMYYAKALKINEKIENKQEIGSCYNNMANVYVDQSDNTKALEYYLKALQLYTETADKQSIVASYINIGAVYQHRSDYPIAATYFKQALKLAEEIADKQLIGSSYVSMGSLYNDLLDFKVAIRYSDSAVSITKEIGAIDNERLAYKNLADAYSKIGKYKEAYESYVNFKALTDSIFNIDNSKQLGDVKTKFEVEKKEAELQLKAEGERILNKEEKKRQQLIIYAVAGLLLIVFLFSMFLFRRFKVIQKQKRIIELQKDEVYRQKQMVEEHQKEIIDSITYAKRLQQAILPADAEIKKYVPDSFIYYQPKDIVAGDFYWMEHLDAITFIAAADSTGHGVPGAMVSVVCSNALNRAVKEFGLRDPGKILDKTRELVLETFEKSGEEIKDGMDISLLAIDTHHQKIFWSGANNPLWYISNNLLKEVKANKQPIGKIDNPKPFTTHALALQKGDTFYLMTDGFADQFGGSKGKKFKYKQLEEMLLVNSHKGLTEQKILLAQSFEEWKGDLEQVDDVTILGVKI